MRLGFALPKHSAASMCATFSSCTSLALCMRPSCCYASLSGELIVAPFIMANDPSALDADKVKAQAYRDAALSAEQEATDAIKECDTAAACIRDSYRTPVMSMPRLVSRAWRMMTWTMLPSSMPGPRS